jgi:hypothetical protein
MTKGKITKEELERSIAERVAKGETDTPLLADTIGKQEAEDMMMAYLLGKDNMDEPDDPEDEE